MPNRTLVTPVKPEPEIVTTEPAVTDAGTRPVIAGFTVYVGVEASVEPTRRMAPVAASSGTVAVIVVGLTKVNAVPASLAPTKSIIVTVSRCEPVMVSVEPATPEVGEIELTLGPAMKSPSVLALPSDAVTVTGPSTTPLGTVAVMRVADCTL